MSSKPIHTDDGSATIEAYTQAVIMADQLLFTSGQLYTAPCYCCRQDPEKRH